MSKKFYITTPLYYPSGNLHVGHTYTTVAADALARYKRSRGYDVQFLTGTDEHGQKIEQVAIEKELSPKQYVDEMIEKIKELWNTLEISYDIFIRTTDKEHEEVVQKIFTKLFEKGDIYKGNYEGHYCTPCESFWTESQLVDGKCPDCGREVQLAKEEAYFFKLSKYQEPLMKLFEEGRDFLKPDNRGKEMVNNFLKPGLEDLCVSRTTFDWGVKVPFDEKHVIYVWFDAVINYISALGIYSDNDEKFNKYWPADVHFVGKEIVRFHTIIWPAILMALDIEIPKQVFGHGWIIFENDKMSKSKGNVIYSEPIIELYGIDALKYFLLREFSFGSDGNFSREGFLTRMNADLANDLGNLVSRTITMIDKYFEGIVPERALIEEIDDSLLSVVNENISEYEENMENYNFSEALSNVWKIISRSNKYIDETKPWVLGKEPESKERLKTVLYNLGEVLFKVSILIRPFMEHTANAIFEQLGLDNPDISWDMLKDENSFESGQRVSKHSPMFPRVDVKKEIDRWNEANQKFIDERNGNKDELKIPFKDEISIDDFDKLDFRVATVKEVKKHPKADRLLVFQLDVAGNNRQIVSGIAEYYKPEDLVGKQVIIIANLKPIKLRGVESCGMILSASNDDELSVLTSLKNVKSGSVVS